MENTETQVWLEFALSFEFIKQEKFELLMTKSEEIGKLLNHMLENPQKYIGNFKN